MHGHSRRYCNRNLRDVGKACQSRCQEVGQIHTRVLDILDPDRRDKLLKACEVSDVWGISRRMTEHLHGMKIRTAWDLAQSAPWMLRQKFNVVVEKTARELSGLADLELEKAAPPKQEICCRRMFGKRLYDLPGTPD
jgi:DNA polymerase V